jgi:hypothetical protein
MGPAARCHAREEPFGILPQASCRGRGGRAEDLPGLTRQGMGRGRTEPLFPRHVKSRTAEAAKTGQM